MLSDHTQSDQDASCFDLAGCNPTIPKQYIITLIMKTCLGWDWKVGGAGKFRSINEPECIFEFSTKITTCIGALMPVGMGKGSTFEHISIYSGNFSS